MESTPRTSYPNPQRRQNYTPSYYTLATPAWKRAHVKTPCTPRLLASTRKFGAEGEENVSFDGLVSKQWKVFSLSPLYNFKQSRPLFKKYAYSLDVAFSKSNAANLVDMNPVKSGFSVYPGLKTCDDDPEAVKIQLVEGGQDGKIVLTAILMCVDIEDSPVQEPLRSHFTYYPVILVAGNKGRADTLLSWLERHFDCNAEPLQFSHKNLQLLLAAWSSQIEPVRNLPVLMQYSLREISEDLGISTIDCKVNSTFCKELWERLQDDASWDESRVDPNQVTRYVNALEKHLEYIMSICFGKLCLSEVGTPVAYVSYLGKLKLLSKSRCAVYLALHLLCTISRDRLMYGS